MMIDHSFLRIDNLNKTFEFQGSEEKILDNLNFAIQKGKIIGVIGRSGAGKSTLLRCLSGLEKPDSGSIFLRGENLWALASDELRQLRQKIGIIFQTYNLLQSKNVFDNIALPLVLRGLNKKQCQNPVEELAYMVGLSHKLKAYPHQLSGGQCQRVSIARALINKPEILMCDEFTSALDPETIADILSLIHHLKKQFNLTIMLVTHDMNVVRQIADYVYVLDKGNFVEQGSTIDILTRPRHSVTKLLLNEFLKDQLPEFIQNKIRSVPCDNDDVALKLVFSSSTSTQPFISNLAQQWGFTINIIGGNLHHSQQQTFGHLMVSLKYNKNQLEEMITYLENNHVYVEILGYLQWET